MSAPAQIAHYRITGKLGEGGMGAVYRASDTKLNREVAIKVLPDELGFDADRLARFTREAHVLASLNHPNIATIYGVENRAIVMELVEGLPLAGPLSDELAMPLVLQLIDALEYAHDKGVVHRDLKPANILVTTDGRLKVLDFGLAKALAGERETVRNPETSPTLTMNATSAGLIMGTAAYMSPEQARGGAVDRRSDIWSFGVVLFELLTGRRLFEGENVSDILAAVLRQDLDLSGVPARFQKLLGLCLKRDPRQRLRDISGARLLLDEVPAPVSRSGWLPWAVAGLALAACGAAAWLWPKGNDPGLGVVRFALTLPDGSLQSIGAAAPQFVPSPDGRNLAITAVGTGSGKSGIWIRPLGSTLARKLDQTDDGYYPFWSPDGQFIAFFADNKLKRVAASGGSAQTICTAPNPGRIGAFAGDGGAWNGDGVIVFSTGGAGASLMRVPAIGGDAATATALEKDEAGHSWPQFLPGGRHVLYLSRNKDSAKNAIYVQEMGASKRVRVIENASRAMWSPPGYLLFVREGNLFAQRMDPKTFQVEGEPLTVAEGIQENTTNGRSAFAVSRNGVLAYRGGSPFSDSQLTWYDRAGKRLGVVGKPSLILNPGLSPDGKSIAVLVGASTTASGTVDTWVIDTGTGVMSRMTRDFMASIVSTPAWSPDSRRLAVTGSSGGIQEVTVASGKVTSLLSENFYTHDWTPDGRSLLIGSNGGARLSLLTLGEGAKPQTILDTPYYKFSSRISPDGRYVAYASSEAGPLDVYVASFPSFAVKRKVSGGGGFAPVWAKNGKEIFYTSSDGSVFAAEIRTSPSLVADAPKLLFKGPPAPSTFNSFAVSADGRRFLFAERVAATAVEQPGIQLVLNWTAGLK